ncbi:MAG: inorganic phosphate transporter [Ruminococcaceae bacterium]|nr:inorganic phosphate transporter [Oscillospiraceae bacterium]
MIYLLLLSGLFMGWSLGTNDAANAFGTAVSTRVIRYRTAVIIIAILVIVGAFLQGEGNIGKLSELAQSNKVIATGEDVSRAIEQDAVESLRWKSAIKAAIIFGCAGLTVFVMSYLKFPVSANQSITGAIIGWGLFHANYSDPAVLGVNLPQIGKFASTWLINPLGAGLISFVLVFFVKKFLEERLTTMRSYDMLVKIGYLVAGSIAAYSIGVNSSASVTALYFDAAYADTDVATNILTDARLTAVIGGVAIAIGVLTFSKRVMMTVGGSIANISQIDGFLVIIAMAVTILLMEKMMGIPVSTSQAVVGAVIGAGLVSGVKNVNFGVFKRIAIAWVSSPTVAGLLTYLVALATQNYLA